MSFKVTAVTKSQGSSTNKVDYDALNKFTVETADLQERQTLVGYIAGIVDLGEQEIEDAEYPFDGTPEDESEIISKYPDTYFKDGISEQTKKPIRIKCFPQRPQQCVALAVDFPDIMIDKGQFFGKSNPQPLRLWTGGQFYIQGTGMVVGRPTPLKVVKMENGKWSFAKIHMLHKMAVAAKLVKPDEAFLPQDIDQLLGKSFQWEAQVHFKESKGKQYYTEYLKFQGALGRGQSGGEPKTELFLLQFDDENNQVALGNLRSHIINTIKKAENYQGSSIQHQLESISVEEGASASSPAPAPKLPAKPSKPVEDEVDPDSPF